MTTDETVRIHHDTYNLFIRNTEILRRAGRRSDVAPILLEIERELDEEKDNG